MTTTATTAEARWAARPVLASTVRVLVWLVPLLVALAVTVALSRAFPPPAALAGRLAWYVGVLALSLLASWVVNKLAQRALPLAVLLEMSLCFPDGAPSRLRLGRRCSSTEELAMLRTAPEDESVQQAAERMLVLIAALGHHDRRTRGHAERVRAYSELIARAVGLSERDRDRLRWAALLHDIGKLSVPADLLNKPGKPDADEWVVLHQHPKNGAQIAAPLLAWLAPMGDVIEEHHERWDGSGYPAGKKGSEVSLGSRIVQVADTFEVMTSPRSYQRPVRKEAALRELVRCAGSQFDPDVVRALLAVPSRPLLWAMGPTAWLGLLPLLGQSTVRVVRTGAGHAGTATASAAMVGLVGIAATSAAHGHSPAVPSQGATVQDQQQQAAVTTSVPPAGSTTSGASEGSTAARTWTTVVTPKPHPAVRVSVTRPRTTPAKAPTQPARAKAKAAPTRAPAAVPRQDNETDSHEPKHKLPEVEPLKAPRPGDAH